MDVPYADTRGYEYKLTHLPITGPIVIELLMLLQFASHRGNEVDEISS